MFVRAFSFCLRSSLMALTAVLVQAPAAFALSPYADAHDGALAALEHVAKHYGVYARWSIYGVRATAFEGGEVEVKVSGFHRAGEAFSDFLQCFDDGPASARWSCRVDETDEPEAFSGRIGLDPDELKSSMILALELALAKGARRSELRRVALAVSHGVASVDLYFGELERPTSYGCSRSVQGALECRSYR